jgi:hypothetical protein
MMHPATHSQKNALPLLKATPSTNKEDTFNSKKIQSKGGREGKEKRPTTPNVSIIQLLDS